MAKPHTRLSRWAHRKGIARGISATFRSGGYQQSVVQTALPMRTLAMYGNHWFYGGRVMARTRTGRFAWRWTIVPRSS